MPLSSSRPSAPLETAADRPRVRRIRRPRALTAGALVLGAALVAGLAGCASDPVADQYRNGDNKGYIGSDGMRVEEIKPADRSKPVAFAGTLENGKKFRSADIAGDVAVVNFWYAACGPCRVEAKDLESVWQKFDGKGVSFVGVNTYDQPGTAQSFNEKYGVTYPSIIDVNTGDAKYAFAEVTSIQATPTTLVLDKQGRVAARVIGPIGSASILETLVQDALNEK
ncbi:MULTISPECIES: TlpA family protein disulfide reductase [unclassified Microbacterium]|uniref:TlpA family protein disulfide reductase n=1 Tax=unclassified Microbacterium TaxID=2609290 RepID=UPI001DC15B39|nr:TlpA family protein disulfide reductase [Actinomycetota bacterium]MBS1901595.1 TlpA family protein disulfide reductase [Actinomycetota bacterium]